MTDTTLKSSTRLQRRSTVDNLRHPWDGQDSTLQKRNSQLFSWDDEFWKKSIKGQQSLASSASTFEEVESLCLSKSSSDSMCSAQRQWERYGNGGPLRGTVPARRFISRQSSTTSTSTSRSSGLMGDAAGGEASSELNTDECQFIADTLLESMDFLGAQGSLDMADKYYLEKIFKRVLEWNNVMPESASKTASIDDVQLKDSKHSKKVLTKQERHRDANSPRSHAALRETLLKLRHNEKVNSSAQHFHQAESRMLQKVSDPQTRRLRDLILPNEDDADTDSRKYSHPLRSARKNYRMKRETSHLSRDTSVSSKAFSDNSASKHSCVSSMSSLSMDIGSPIGSSPQDATETQQRTHQANLATFLPQYSLQPTCSFDSSASQNCATSHAERVLMGLGFGAAEGFLPERFLKDWHSKISKAQTESVANAELKRQKSVNNPAANVDVNNQRFPQSPKESSPSGRHKEASSGLPSANDKRAKLERLREYISAYTNNISSTDGDREMAMSQSLFSTQNSSPLCKQTLRKLKEKSRHFGLDTSDKETQLQRFVSDNKPYVMKNGRPEYSRNERHSEWDATGCSSEDRNNDSREHPPKRTSRNNLNTHLEKTIGSLQQIMQRQLINSDTPKDSKANPEIGKNNFPGNKQADGTKRRSPSHISNGNACGPRPLRSPTRQIAIDVCDPVHKNEKQRKNMKYDDNMTTENIINKDTTNKTCVGKEPHYPNGKKRTPNKSESLISKDSEEVASIMQNQPSREQCCSTANQQHDKVNSNQVRPLKSALKHVEPAMVSIVLEDTDQGDGTCNADILSVTPEGIHLVIPLSACNYSSLSPIPQSPVTVIEVGLDNQQDSLDMEGTHSSKDTDDDNFNHPSLFNSEEYGTLKPKHDRRRSLLSFTLKPEHPQRRRSTGIISPIPCQLSLIQMPNCSKEGQTRRRLSLEVPVIPEIRNLLEKQKGLLTNQSKDTLDEPKKGREKRRASFSEAEPIIINDVLAKQRGLSSTDEENCDSRLDNIKNQDMVTDSKYTPTGQIGKDVVTIERKNSEIIQNSSCREQHTPKTFDYAKDRALANLNPHVTDDTGHTTVMIGTHAIQHNNNTSLNVNAIHKCGIVDMRSINSSPRSAKSAFRTASKRNFENKPCNGYFSETDAEEFPVTVNPDLKPRPVSSIARYLEGGTNNTQGEVYSSLSNTISKSADSASAITVQCLNSNPTYNSSASIHHEKVKAQMISRAVEVNSPTCPYSQDNNNQFNSSEYYYACDKSTQCSLKGSGFETPSHKINSFNSTSTQTGICRHEVSSQTTDLFYFVNSSYNGKTESKAVNTVVCLIGREHGTNYLKHSTNYTAANYNNIDETIREIDAELTNIELRNYQRSRQMNAGKSAERSNPVCPIHGHADNMFPRVSSNYYQYQSQHRIPRDRTHKLALKRCAPSNWQDATELTDTSQSSDDIIDRSIDNRTWLRDNESKLMINNYEHDTHMSRISGVKSIATDVCPSIELSGTFADSEEDKLLCIVHPNKDMPSTSFLRSNKSSPKDNDRVSTKMYQYDTSKAYIGVVRNNENKPDNELINPKQKHQTLLNGENNNIPSEITFKPNNKLHGDISSEYAASDSKDNTLKEMDSFFEKCKETQSNAPVYEKNGDRDVTATSVDLNATRNASTRLKLVNTKQMMRIDSNESTLFLQTLGKEQSDKVHSKLSRLNYNQSSHRSSGSSFDIELDFMNAGEPIGLLKCSDSISQALQDCKRQIKKQNRVQQVVDPAQRDSATIQPNIIFESSNEGTLLPNISIDVSNMPSPDEKTYLEENTTYMDLPETVQGIRRETYSDKRNTTSVENVFNGTENSAYYSTPADANFNGDKPLVPNISKLKLENSFRIQGTPENCMTVTSSGGTDFLQVPGSPDYLFNRARYPAVLGISTSSASSVASSKAQTHENVTIEVKDNNLSMTQDVVNNMIVTDCSTGFDSFSAVRELEDNREDIEIKEGIERNEGSETKNILTNTYEATVKTFSQLRSLEKSCDECSDVSIYPILSNDSAIDGNHADNSVIDVWGNGNTVIDLDKIEIGTLQNIATYPQVFDPDVFNINHKIRRTQSAGDWPTLPGDQETCDVDSNKSVVGSELDQDLDDMEVFEIESRKHRSNSDSSYSDLLLDLNDSLSQDSDSNESTKKDVSNPCLLTPACFTDDLLQVSDFGGLSPTSLQRKALSPSPSSSVRSHERHRHSPSYTTVRSPPRDFPPEPIQYNDSDDDLDSEAERKIREQLRQVRRESRRNSKDNWDAIHCVLLSHNKVSDDSPQNQEETSCNELNPSDNVISLPYPAIVTPGEQNICPVDGSSGDKCDKEISRINLNRPATRKLIKMSSDPVDKDVYCRSISSMLANENISRLQNSPVVEESLNDFENVGQSCKVKTHEDGLDIAPLSNIPDLSADVSMETSSAAGISSMENNTKSCETPRIENKVEESSSIINKLSDGNLKIDNVQNNKNAARILEVEFINDDVDSDTSLIKDRQDSLPESSTNILDELEIFALFKKIDGYESSVNTYVDYSIESSSSSSSEEFKLSQISEEDTQSEDNTSDESRRHIWHVRSRFVLPQDTLESTLDGITRQDSVSSTYSYRSDSQEILPNVDVTAVSGPNTVKPIHESNSSTSYHSDVNLPHIEDAAIIYGPNSVTPITNSYSFGDFDCSDHLDCLPNIEENDMISGSKAVKPTHESYCSRASFNSDCLENVEETTISGSNTGKPIYDSHIIKNDVTRNQHLKTAHMDTKEALENDGENSNSILIHPKPSNREICADMDNFVSPQSDSHLEDYQRENDVSDSGNIENRCSQKSSDIYTKVNLCDFSKTKSCSFKENSGFCDVTPKVLADPAFETQIVEWKTDATGVVSTKIINTRVVKTVHLNSSHNNLHCTHAPTNNGTDMSEERRHTATMDILIGDHRRKQDMDNILQQLVLDQVPEGSQESLQTVSNRKYDTAIEDTSIVNAVSTLSQNNHHHKLSDKIVQRQNNLEVNDKFSDTCNMIHEEIGIGIDVTDNVLTDVLNDFLVFGVHGNKKTMFLQTHSQDKECSNQTDLKNKVRELFLIDSSTTSKDAVQDNNKTDASCVVMSPTDSRGKVQSMCIIGNSGIEIFEDGWNEHSNDATELEDVTDTQSFNILPQAVPRDPVHPMFVIDKSGKETTSEDGWNKQNDDVTVQDDLTDRQEHSQVVDSNVNFENDSHDSRELNDAANNSDNAKMHVDVSHTVLSSFFSQTINSEESFEDSCEFIDADYGFVETPTQKLLEQNKNSAQLGRTSSAEAILTTNKDGINVDCNSVFYEAQLRVEDPKSSVVSSDTALSKNMLNETACNNTETNHRMKLPVLEEHQFNTSTLHETQNQLGINSCPVVTLTNNTNYNIGDCENFLSVSPVHVDEPISSLVNSDEVESTTVIHEAICNFIESSNIMNEATFGKNHNSRTKLDHTDSQDKGCSRRNDLKNKVRSLFLIDSIPSIEVHVQDNIISDECCSNINIHTLTADDSATDDSCIVSENESILPVSRKNNVSEGNNNSLLRHINEDKSLCDQNEFGGNNTDILKENWTTVSLGDSVPTSISETGVVDDIKKRVRAMFLLDRNGDSISSDSKLQDHPVSSTESSAPYPTKRTVSVSTVFSQNREHSPTSFVASPLTACRDVQNESLDEECGSLNNDLVTNSDVNINNKEMKNVSSGVDRRSNKNHRVLKYRSSLLRLHEQMKVFSSIGSDSDSELTSALKNQGDYDIRTRDLSLGRISSDNNDEEEAVNASEIFLKAAFAILPEASSAILPQAPNEITGHGNRLQDSSDSADTLVNSKSNSVELDVKGSLNGTNGISKSKSLESDVRCPTPKVVVQQPSDEQLSLTQTAANSTSTTLLSNSKSDVPVPPDKKENLNQSLSHPNSGERRHFSKRFSSRPGASFTWLRNNPHANFLTPERALTHTTPYNNITNQSPYTRIPDDSHPELSYLDIVSKLKQREVYKTKPTKQSDVELVISPPDTKNRHSSKMVRFCLNENISSTLSSEHTEDKKSAEIK